MPVYKGQHSLFALLLVIFDLNGRGCSIFTSGVLSLTANPVPPLLMIRLTASSPSVHRVTNLWISRMSSGTICVTDTSHWSFPTVSKTSWRIAVHLSEEGSCDAVSETISMAALSLLVFMFEGGGRNSERWPEMAEIAQRLSTRFFMWCSKPIYKRHIFAQLVEPRNLWITISLWVQISAAIE